MSEIALYPLLTEPRTVQPIWGGTQLAAWLELPEPHPERLGESWQVYDDNPVVNGPLAGQTLAQLAARYGATLVGSRTMERYGADFPLLAKFIDAADRLSIQVHPDDAYAHSQEAHTGFHGKTEAWYILHAAPGASVIYGLARPSDRASFTQAVASDAVESLLRSVEVRAGDVIFVPAGTVHAIGAGIMLFEIQQKSDLTYRVYDYGRRDARTGQPRELHLEKALEVMDFTVAPRTTIPPLPLAQGRELLLACPLFALERLELDSDQRLDSDPASFEILTLLEGQVALQWAGGQLELRQGSSVVLPAAIEGYTLSQARPGAPAPRLLRVYVPDLVRDLQAPLRARGVDAARIATTIIG